MVQSDREQPRERPVELATGDQVAVNMQAKRVENRYERIWSTQIYTADGKQKVDYCQSTFYARVWPPRILQTVLPVDTETDELESKKKGG